MHAGRRHLFIRLAGCNLRCRYCDTPHSLERVAQFHVRRAAADTLTANPVAVEPLLATLRSLAEGDGPIDGVALTGGEPLLQADFLAQLLQSNVLPHPRLLETSGILPDKLEQVLPYVDAVSMDFKLPSNTGETSFWEEHLRFLFLARGKVYVKIPVDRGTTITELEHAAKLIRMIAPETPVLLQPISGTDGCIDTSESDLTAFFHAARRYLDDVRVLPQAHKALGIR